MSAREESAEGDAFPGDAEMGRWADEACADAYVDAVDPTTSANLDYSFGGAPIGQTWQSGHRTVTCVLWDRFAPLTRSVLQD